MISRLTYRSRQFWNALLSPYTRVPSEILLAVLTPTQIVLFRRLQPAEQTHAHSIFKHLQAEGNSTADLLAAALLHDVGKILHPLSIFDRVLIVVGKRLFPHKSARWAEGPAHGLRLPFVVAERHAGWGAELAAQAGASPQTVELIRRHHEPRLANPGSPIEHLLAALQAADGKN